MTHRVSAPDIAKVTLQENTRLIRAGNVVFTDLDDELIIIAPDAESVFSLNATARCGWILMAEPITFADLCRGLAVAFEVDPQQCAEEVAELVVTLHRKGLVAIEHGGA